MKKLQLLVCGAALGFAFAGSAAEMDYSTPEAEGVSSAAISAWIDACERELDAVHGFVIVRHGKTIAEGWWKPFSADRTHTLYSHSKSFTSTAIGLLADAGKLDLDERVADIFPEKLPPNPSPKLRSMRIRDLLTMNTGMPNGDPERKDPGGDWVSLFLANEVKYDPGTWYLYDSCATYMLSAIVEKKSGEKLMDFLGKRFFQPIGITKAWSSTSPQGIACGGWGMNMTTRELARFGQLYLQEGRWGDKQILSRDWVRLATAKQTGTRRDPAGDWGQGYGFQFWRCRHNCYRADGAAGQYTVVMPEQDAVVSINAGLGPMGHELNLVWKYLLPAMKEGALPADPTAAGKLKERSSNLALKTVRGQAAAPAGVFGKTYDLALNYRFDFKTVRLEEKDGGWEVVFGRANGKEVRIPVGYGTWREGAAVFEDLTYEALGGVIGLQPTAASGAWNGRTFRFRAYLHNTFFRLDSALTFKEDGTLAIDFDLWGWGGRPAKGTGKVRKTIPINYPKDLKLEIQPRHDYSKTLSGKLFLAQALFDGPFKRCDNGKVNVAMTLEQAAEAIKGMDAITLGMPKIMYLVGWQYNGHDSKYPALFEGNAAVKRTCDANALDSVRWLMDLGFKYHTAVSLHINMFDAYKDSPLWDEYVAHDIIGKDKDGKLIESEWGWKISYAQEWKTGFAQKRLDRLLELLPIQKAGTLHIDAFHSRVPIGYLDQNGRHCVRWQPIPSPYLPFTQQDEIEAQKNIIRYLDKKGVDVTEEGNIQFFSGLIPMSWHFGTGQYFSCPRSLYCGVNNASRWGRVFGTCLNTETIFNQYGPTPKGFQVFTSEFCRKSLLSNYLFRLTPVEAIEGANYNAVKFANGVFSELDGDRYTLKADDCVLADGDDLLMPALWTPERDLLAFSGRGYAKRTWRLTKDWPASGTVKLFTVDEHGPHPAGELAYSNRQLELSLKPGQLVRVLAQ